MRDEDMLREIEQFQRQAAALRSVLEDAQAQAPRTSTGTDSSGSVRVTVSRDGLPLEIRVDSSWRQQLTPSGLGPAVVEGAHAAGQARLAAWSEILNTGNWQAEAEEILRSDEASSSWTTPLNEVPPMFRAAPAGPPTRGLDELAEDMMSALRKAERTGAASPAVAEVIGEAFDGKVAVALSRSAGLTRCEIAVEWAAEANAREVNRGLERALDDAIDKLNALSDDPGPGGGLDAMFAEAMGFLQNPIR